MKSNRHSRGVHWINNINISSKIFSVNTYIVRLSGGTIPRFDSRCKAIKRVKDSSQPPRGRFLFKLVGILAAPSWPVISYFSKIRLNLVVNFPASAPPTSDIELNCRFVWCHLCDNLQTILGRFFCVPYLNFVFNTVLWWVFVCAYSMRLLFAWYLVFVCVLYSDKVCYSGCHIFSVEHVIDWQSHYHRIVNIKLSLKLYSDQKN